MSNIRKYLAAYAKLQLWKKGVNVISDMDSLMDELDGAWLDLDNSERASLDTFLEVLRGTENS